jgi:hypothetical protein
MVLRHTMECGKFRKIFRFALWTFRGMTRIISERVGQVYESLGDFPMPRRARGKVIDESRPGTYHVSTRCARRSSFRDRTPGGLNPIHRQEWIFLRLRALALLFAIDILDFAILDNEFHVVLRNRPDRARKMSPEEVVRRWLRLSRWSLGLKAEPTAEQIKEELAKPKRLAELRRRLSRISWFMIMLKEPIARAANKEDGVRGHFFAERFDADKLEDGEQRLATSLQINSLAVRLGHANDLASSRFTAAYARLHGDGDWLAGELTEEVSQNSAESPVSESEASPASDEPHVSNQSHRQLASDQSEGEAAAESAGTADSSDVYANGAAEASDSAEAERVAGEATDGGISAAGTCGTAGVAKKSPVFNRLPLDVYLDWLASNIVSVVGDDPELETPALRMPKELPEAWLRYGLNAANWEDAVKTITRRFLWMARTASAMRRDCRRFVADSSPPLG